MRTSEVEEAMKKIVVFLLPILGLTTAQAQEQAVDDSSAVVELRRYAVEIIVFRYTEDFGLGSEQFYPDELPLTDTGVPVDNTEMIDEVQVGQAARSLDLWTYAANAGALRFEPMAEDEFTLTAVVDRFERLDAYETMMHFGWTQPGLPPDQTKPVEIGIFGMPPEGLQGTLSLYLSRYLHLVVDFELDAEAGATDTGFQEPVASFGDPVDRYIDPLARAEQHVYYRISEDRIVKDGDIRYFDHPKFGIVAKVTRLEDDNSGPNLEDGLLGGTGQ